MKAWEICKEENVGKKFKDSNGKEWKVCKHVFNSTYYDLQDRFDNHISKQYYLSTIAELDFEEIIDWSKVPVDTKVIVYSELNKVWLKRHFAKYEDGKKYVFDGGYSSYTAENPKHDITSYKYVKLYDGKEMILGNENM